jgi:hypothetical protein
MRPVGIDDTAMFVGCRYTSKKRDGFYEPAAHSQQRTKQRLRSVQRPPHAIGDADAARTDSFGERQGFRVSGGGDEPLRVSQYVRLSDLRRLKCRYCGGISNFPPYVFFPHPTMPGLLPVPGWPGDWR